jgi:hypothetical protein
MWKSLITGLIAIPVLALFGGIGFLAYRVGQQWDARSTDSLITGLVATCGGGVLIVGILLALLVGVPLALRSYSEAGRARQAWHELPPPSYAREPDGRNAIDAAWQRLPPALPQPANQAPLPPIPPWGATGGGQYQLLPPQDRRFGEAGAEGQGRPSRGHLLE